MPEYDDAATGPVTPQDEAFLQVLAHHTMLKAYILAIIHDPHLAEDTLSDVTLAIVRSWERFDKQQPFAPWARGVARRIALANRRKFQRPVIELNETVLEAVGLHIDALGSEGVLEERRQQLRACVEQLPEHSRELVQLRYFAGQSYDHMASSTGRTIVALYKAFSRIHEALARCVRSAFPA